MGIMKRHMHTRNVNYWVKGKLSDEENEDTSVWDNSVKVEENGYYWKGEPIFAKRPIRTGERPIVIELFCGCGGTSLGFEMAGYEVVLGLDVHIPSIKTFEVCRSM